uniref:Tetraspanin n=1 Tax=Macrostomum lignano TaxID=282301 RepID=A0A1I8IK98_9PLAT
MVIQWSPYLATWVRTRIKTCLFVVNSLLLVGGALLLGVCWRVFTQFDAMRYSSLGLVNINSIVLIRVGFVFCAFLAIIIAALGCVVACKESFGFVQLHLTLLALLLMVHLSAVSLAAASASRYRTIDDSKLSLKSIRDQYGLFSRNSTAVDDVTAAVDSFQAEFTCCGWSGRVGSRNIFLETPWFRRQGSGNSATHKLFYYPESCCNPAVDREKLSKCTLAENELLARRIGYMHPALICLVFDSIAISAFSSLDNRVYDKGQFV